METWYSVMAVDNDDCLIPIYFAKIKETAEFEYKLYSSQGSMQHRGHKRVIFSTSTQIAEVTQPMGELINEEQAPTYDQIVR
jgi:hypothetical protein